MPRRTHEAPSALRSCRRALMAAVAVIGTAWVATLLLAAPAHALELPKAGADGKGLVGTVLQTATPVTAPVKQVAEPVERAVERVVAPRAQAPAPAPAPAPAAKPAPAPAPAAKPAPAPEPAPASEPSAPAPQQSVTPEPAAERPTREADAAAARGERPRLQLRSRTEALVGTTLQTTDRVLDRVERVVHTTPDRLERLDREVLRPLVQVGTSTLLPGLDLGHELGDVVAPVIDPVLDPAVRPVMLPQPSPAPASTPVAADTRPTTPTSPGGEAPGRQTERRTTPLAASTDALTPASPTTVPLDSVPAAGSATEQDVPSSPLPSLPEGGALPQVASGSTLAGQPADTTGVPVLWRLQPLADDVALRHAEPLPAAGPRPGVTPD